MCGCLLQLRNLILKIPTLKAFSPKRNCAWDDLVELRKSLRKIALYDILISAQVRTAGSGGGQGCQPDITKPGLIGKLCSGLGQCFSIGALPGLAAA